MRDPDGTFTTLYIPGEREALTNITINDAGTIMGYYPSTPTVDAGFIKRRGRDVITFAYPGASYFTPAGLNNLDVVTGYYRLLFKGPTEGFIYVPGN